MPVTAKIRRHHAFTLADIVSASELLAKPVKMSEEFRIIELAPRVSLIKKYISKNYHHYFLEGATEKAIHVVIYNLLNAKDVEYETLVFRNKHPSFRGRHA